MAEGESAAPPREYDRMRNAVLFPEAGKGRVLRLLFSDLATIERETLKRATDKKDIGQPGIEQDVQTWVDKLEVLLGGYDPRLTELLFRHALKTDDFKTHVNPLDPSKPMVFGPDDMSLTLDKLIMPLRDVLFLCVFGKTAQEAYVSMQERVAADIKARREQAANGGGAAEPEADPQTAELSATAFADELSAPA